MIPDLTTLLANPARAADVPAEAIPAVLADLGAEEGKLTTVRSILAARLAAGTFRNLARMGSNEGELLKVDEAARRLGMSAPWLYKNAGRLPFTRRVGPRTLRFSADGISRYLARRGS